MTARGVSGSSRSLGKRASGGAPRVPFALLVTGLIVGGLALLVALNTASAANELRRHSLADRDAQVVAAVEELRNEVAASAAPANLAAAAHALGMVPAGNPAFIVLGADGSAKVLGHPAAVTGPPVPVAAPSPAPHPTTAAGDKPRSTATPTLTSTASSTSPATATATAAKSAKAGRANTTAGASRTPSSPSPTPATSARPTPTPTPTMTLPGGAR